MSKTLEMILIAHACLAHLIMQVEPRHRLAWSLL